ncbi:MAG: hypothetical protein J6S63_06860 [Atopobiaceae bacterium]|nr:hypothetical protein [Atopobiaceae bacterium]
MTATDELRRLLDERGVKWRWDNGTATWYVDGVMYNAWGYDNERLTMSVCHLTPEQAVEATLGRGTCHDVFEVDAMSEDERIGEYVCSECGETFNDGHGESPHYCPNCGRRIEQ